MEPSMGPAKLVCLLMIAGGMAFAQYTSGFEGTVVDQSGAAVANAHIVATNRATRVVREANANDSGYFRIPELAPGVYGVVIQLPGFQGWAQSDIQVDANQIRT